MLAALVRFSIRFYGVVIAVALVILSYGGYRFLNAGLDIFPEFSPKRVIIQTEAPGLSSEQVEVLVTQPIEMAVSGLIGLKTVRSESIQGLSIVTVNFAPFHRLTSPSGIGICPLYKEPIKDPVDIGLSAGFSSGAERRGFTLANGCPFPDQWLEFLKLRIGFCSLGLKNQRKHYYNNPYCSQCALHAYLLLEVSLKRRKHQANDIHNFLRSYNFTFALRTRSNS